MTSDNQKLNFIKKIFSLIFFFGLLLTCFWLLHRVARAQHFESASFIIDWGNFNMTSGHKNSANYHLTDTVGQNVPGQYDSTHYTLKSGAQYAYITTYPFSFSISDLQINLGSLAVGIASTASNILTVSSPAGHGYQVTVAENHPLAVITTGSTIPDTTCNTVCTESVSGLWTSSSAYGFGYNATGVGSSGYFATANHYRQFANLQSSETPQIVMSETTPQKDRQSIITYKALISGLQPAGTYENSIIYSATPLY